MSRQPGYLSAMTDATSVTVAEDGALVLPASVLERLGWSPGSAPILTETEDDVLLTDRATALSRARSLIGGRPLVDELIADRHREAANADAPA